MVSIEAFVTFLTCRFREWSKERRGVRVCVAWGVFVNGGGSGVSSFTYVGEGLGDVGCCGL